ncbi:Type IV secretory pathway VirB4 components-like protein [Mycolicibacterium vanbaalenii PYR-1]|uniref:Type IV secretory pathway VirB4 components-like protein n=2 Tax=Mycolicibacterium vanbaalenii TaxID=110539 RepID=A1T425_MYCVP|nr:secretory pathway protein VirB4 [Mycolicibacterium vanbaalenii]ABM11925.1 Type IV secretory pathway VirB4 components-like protein [Mycolicibacterium vanbaalenii PYR-1]
MSLRLGAALAEYLRLNLKPAERNFFVLVEGVSSHVAAGMASEWDDALPRLAVAAPEPSRFGAYALTDVSGTQLRNAAGSNGVVLVLCDGEQVPDRQGISLFDSIFPSILLDKPQGLILLCQQKPVVDPDGPVRAVRDAIVQADIAIRPSPKAVADFLDVVAAGNSPLEALPTLGAFTDSVARGDRADAGRILDNLRLASKRTSDDFLRPSAYADFRKRAERVLATRPSLRGKKAEIHAAADSIMSSLQSGSSDLLRELTFHEAREIFEKRSESLTETVLREMANYRAALDPESYAVGLPWDSYESCAHNLGRGADQRAAAQELCDLDDGQQKQLFHRTTRTKLERLLRDKSVNGSKPSCPEAALVRSTQQLGTPIARVQLLAPAAPALNTASATNRSGAGRILTLACARLRLGGLMRRWDSLGVEVDGLLLKAADDEEDLGDVLGAFSDAGLADGTPLALLQLRIHDADGTTVQIDWRPDLDDAALLRAVLLFASDAPSLTLATLTEPTLTEFCGHEQPEPIHPVPAALMPLAQTLHTTAKTALERGLTPELLSNWSHAWTATVNEQHEKDADSAIAETLTLAGGVLLKGECAALTGLAPLKAEWLSQQLTALWDLLLNSAGTPGKSEVPDAVSASTGIASATAAHHPAHLRLRNQDQPFLPSSEGRIWSLYGGSATRDQSGFADEALRSVITQLLTLQPETAGHLRCVTWGPGAADLMIAEATRMIGAKVGRAEVKKVEIFCVGVTEECRPQWATLAEADKKFRAERDVLQIRYIDDLPTLKRILRPADESPAVHLALVTGLTEGGNRPQLETPEVLPPAEDPDILFTPRVWQRPKQDRRTLLMPPTASSSGQAWLRLQNAVDETWPDMQVELRVPEVRTGTGAIRIQLEQIHEIALWVATLDRYATRDSLEQALGPGNVAILHQERRLGGDSPLSLVLSQKAGGPVDRAIGRSLRAAGIVDNSDIALSIGTDLRKVASQGYGILALQAATSGAGINELVGHVVAFSLLATTATPWPLPAGCRVLLVSLDEYRHWFPTKRADLLAIALDPREGGVHVAAIEVKARRSDEADAAAGALDQLIQTLSATRFAAYPEPDSINSRLWLNRITEAAYAVARESRFRLDADELAALEAFRRGRGTLEWAGVGLVFGPNVKPLQRIQQNPVGNDIVPIALHSLKLTEELLRDATATDLTKLRTVETDRAPLEGTRRRRRPETKPPGGDEPPRGDSGEDDEPDGDGPNEQDPTPPPRPEPEDGPKKPESGDDRIVVTPPSAPRPFVAPVLGWDAVSEEEIRWHPAGAGQDVLQNGHVEIWGSSGMGKTQFVMTLLAQLSRHSGTHFGIADFKNDYSDANGFPEFADAEFLDLWEEGAPYNPLALTNDSERSIETAVIELRDTIEEATRSFTRMGVRQKAKLNKALAAAYATGRSEGRWPTLRTLDEQLDDDLAGVMGDLTRHRLFKEGPPLGDVIDRNVVFGLSKIPGNGQTTILAAGFILSALLLRIQNLPPVPNTIRYVGVIDEAHRVADFKAVQTMIREGRSKGLAVVLATQQPLDLQEVTGANAQTRICFGLPDATYATMAARKMQPDNHRLAEQIRTLGVGEAYLSLRGSAPRLVRMVQAYRDAERLGLPPLRHI